MNNSMNSVHRPSNNKKKKAQKKSKSAINSKLTIVTGDTLLIRDYILNELKPRHNLTIQTISPTVRRTATHFKMHIFDGSQSNAAFKDNSILRSFNANKQTIQSTTADSMLSE